MAADRYTQELLGNTKDSNIRIIGIQKEDKHGSGRVWGGCRGGGGGGGADLKS